ncbi:ADP-ribosylglycohydrolase family protein [Nostoc sp. CMAA1605]|uniref:ADP-ribosylglycohydrolase family protein n=1 Tax=Nostoc sp. CMAA1605 TaxID=2055159 RepID=UPI001F223A7E|nr:ADP-ribosylglycohydrolase family protein [Nostoc sp. CMAA1605]
MFVWASFWRCVGAATEFLTVEEICRRFPPHGPQEISGNPALVTDDTQMMLAVGQALIKAETNLNVSNLEATLRNAFIKWLHSPDNNRAPGLTCLRSCQELETGIPWQQATRKNSKGCGANMRVAPVGLLQLDKTKRAAIAQFQAALTHGHPTALAASDLTATAIAFLIQGCTPQDLPTQLYEYALSQRLIYHADWLGDLWQQPYINTPEEFISRGWDECFAILERLNTALVNPNRETDPCLATGEGWIAEEAFATGLLCFLFFPEQPLAALHRAAVTAGDSDSIACLTGAFAGAYLGMSAWPEDWVNRIEYREQIAALGNR